MNRLWRFGASQKYLPDGVLLGEVPATAFITTARLAADAADFCTCLPADIDAIVGVARSGLIPAAIAATWLHVPLYSTSASMLHAPTPVLDLAGGFRLQPAHSSLKPQTSSLKVLVIDDTAANGHSAKKLRKHVQAAFPQAEVFLAAIYSTTRGLASLDFAAFLYEGPHYLEWNFWNAGHAERYATDLDGILCEECPHELDDDGHGYERWLQEAAPLYRAVRRPLSLIVTARLEKYRRITEGWLAEHHIAWDRLVMGTWATLAERNEGGPQACVARVAAFKAAAWAAAPEATLFVESDPAQAHLIHAQAVAEKRLGRRVLCPALGRVLE